MAQEKPTVTRQTFYLSILVVFMAGFLSGVGFTVYKLGDSPAAGPAGVAQQQAGPSAQEAQAILNLEAEVTARPENYNAWTQLGHLYFDSDQYQKAIAAYTKSLELHSGNANIWTDLGVMYRRAGDSEKAVETFDKAIAMEPAHEPSRLNKGIVLHFDLGRTTEAVEMWESVLKLNPDATTANGMPLREFVDQVKENKQ